MPSSRLSRSGAYAALLSAGLAVASCGDDEAPKHQEVAGSPGATKVLDEVVLLEARAIEAPPGTEEDLRRRDPDADGWRTEVLHEIAKKSLTGILDALLGEDGAAPALAPYLATEGVVEAEGFGGTHRSVFDDGTTGVRRLAPQEDQGSPDDPRESPEPADWEAVSARLRAGFDGADTLVHHFKIMRVDVGEGASFATSAYVHLDGVRGEERKQLNEEWRLEWEVEGADERARLRRVAVVDSEEVTSERALFGEFSHAAFGPLACWEPEFLRGVADYHQRVDRLLSQDFLGAQGLAVGDLDGDGRDDLYVPQQGGLPNRVLLRKPDGSVRDASHRSGVDFLDESRSALILDFDNDGDQDLAVAVGPNVVVAWNDGRARFVDFTPLEAPDASHVYSMSAADADGDGDLDLYCCRYDAGGILGGVPTPYHDANNGSTNLFWRNDGKRGFSLATAEVGLDVNNTKFSLSALWEDFDDDGDVDLYVANDFGRNNLYRNEGGRFRDVADEVGAEDLGAGMGLSAADYDLDGDVDLYVSNMWSSAGQRIVPQSDRFMGGERVDEHRDYQRHARGNTLLANNGDGSFTDVTDSTAVAVGGWAWGAKFVDFNNDGYEDLYSPNGFVTNTDPDDL